MESYYATFHTKRHMKPSRKLMTVYAVLETRTQTWGLTVKTWLLLAEDDSWRYPLCQTVSCLSGSWWLHSSSTWSSPSNIFVMAIWDVGNRHHQTHQSTNIQQKLVYFSNNRLLLKIGRSYSPEGSEDVWCDQVHQASCPIPLWRGTMMNHPW